MYLKKLENNLQNFLFGLNDFVKKNHSLEVNKNVSDLKKLCYSSLKNLMSFYLTEKQLIIEFKKRENFILDNENLNNYESKKRGESIKNEIINFL